jgi:O-antigen ligase
LIATLGVGIAFGITGYSRWSPRWLKRLSDRGALAHARGVLGYLLLGITALVVFPGFAALTPDRTTNLALCYVAWVGLSIAWSSDKRHCLRRLIHVAIVLAAALGVAASFSLTERVATIAACCGLFLGFGIFDAIRSPEFVDAASGRWLGGLAGPTKQGTNSVMLLFSTLFLLERELLSPALGGAVLLVALSYLFLTNARASVWGSFTATLAWLCLAYARAPDGASWTLLCLPILFLVVGGISRNLPSSRVFYTGEPPSAVTSFIHLGRDPNEIATFNRRSEIWRFVLKNLRLRWLIGFGYSTFWTPQRKRSYGKWEPASSHSSYIEVLADTGVIGLALFTAMLGSAALAGWNMPSPQGEFLLAFVCFVALHCFVEVAFVFGEYETFVLLTLLLRLEG